MCDLCFIQLTIWTYNWILIGTGALKHYSQQVILSLFSECIQVNPHFQTTWGRKCEVRLIGHGAHLDRERKWHCLGTAPHLPSMKRFPPSIKMCLLFTYLQFAILKLYHRFRRDTSWSRQGSLIERGKFVAWWWVLWTGLGWNYGLTVLHYESFVLLSMAHLLRSLQWN